MTMYGVLHVSAKSGCFPCCTDDESQDTESRRLFLSWSIFLHGLILTEQTSFFFCHPRGADKIKVHNALPNQFLLHFGLCRRLSSR
jgi:hypothetical protein